MSSTNKKAKKSKGSAKKVVKKMVKKAPVKKAAPKKATPKKLATVHAKKVVPAKKHEHVTKHEHVAKHAAVVQHAPIAKHHHVNKYAHGTKHENIKKPEHVVPAVKEKPKAKVEIPFQIGEFAVYPAHGVGKIEDLETKTIMGEKMEFLVISILDTGMNVLVPVSNIGNVGLRPVIKPAKVKDVYDVLKQKKRTVVGSTWNRRYREYMEKIKSGSVFEIAEVLRDLIVLKGDKDLSFGERKMLDTAKSLLIKELALAKGVNEKKIEAEIQKIFTPEV